MGCRGGWPVELPPPLSCCEVVKQGQGHSASPGARLYGADASDDPAGFFAFSVHLHSTSDADTLDDEDLCGKTRSTVCIGVAIYTPGIGLTFHTKEMVSRLIY